MGDEPWKREDVDAVLTGQFERTDRLFRERLAYHEARRKAAREAQGPRDQTN